MLITIRLTVTSPTKTFTHTALGENAVKIGRSLRCEFSIPLEDLSREHCLFEIADHNFYITDLGSSNGVWVDQERILPHTKIQITPDSDVSLSNMYQMNITPVEIKTKSDIKIHDNSTPEEVDRDIKTLSLQLEYPEKERTPTTSAFVKKRLTRSTKLKKENGATYEGLKMIMGLLVVVGFIIYHLTFQS